jgi:hypothetical protein
MIYTNPLDTKTRPEPDKSADDLMFDALVYGQYGNMWGRIEDSIAQHMEHAISSPLPQNDDIRSALEAIRNGGLRLPRIENLHFERDRSGNKRLRVPASFKRDQLGMGTNEDYWRTQRSFLDSNQIRGKKHRQLLKELAKARKVLSRSVSV